MDELKLCPVPWCERVNKPEFYNPEPKAYCVACPDCGLETNVFATEAEAIAAWNTRAEASSAEPVAWMYRQMTTAEADHVEFTRTPWINVPPSWTETPLYAHPPAVPDTVNRALVEHMRETIREWERDEPRDDWWLHQHDHAAAADLIETQAREIERLREELMQIEVDAMEYYNDWMEHGCEQVEATRFAFDLGQYARAALAGGSHD